MADIYDQHRKAFERVAAYIVLGKDGQTRIAKIAFKYPADGAGRLYCYLHFIGTEMVRGSATGYGYDKASAAIESAVRVIQTGSKIYPIECADFLEPIWDCKGHDWTQRLEKAGYAVLQAV